jgi:hypothetical protein
VGTETTIDGEAIMAPMFYGKSKVYNSPAVLQAYKELKREITGVRVSGYGNFTAKGLALGLGIIGMPLAGLALFWSSDVSASFFNRDPEKDSAYRRVREHLADTVADELGKMEANAKTSPSALQEFRAEMKVLTKGLRREENCVRTIGLGFFGLGVAVLASTPFGWGVGLLVGSSWLVSALAMKNGMESVREKDLSNRVIRQFAHKLSVA